MSHDKKKQQLEGKTSIFFKCSRGDDPDICWERGYLGARVQISTFRAGIVLQVLWLSWLVSVGLTEENWRQ